MFSLVNLKNVEKECIRKKCIRITYLKISLLVPNQNLKLKMSFFKLKKKTNFKTSFASQNVNLLISSKEHKYLIGH